VETKNVDARIKSSQDDSKSFPGRQTVIRCLTIADQDAVALIIASELAVHGHPLCRLDDRIREPMSPCFGMEAL
jgi:hypothetical protein